MTEQEYKEICEEVQNSGIPVPSQQKIIKACGKQVAKNKTTLTDFEFGISNTIQAYVNGMAKETDDLIIGVMQEYLTAQGINRIYEINGANLIACISKQIPKKPRESECDDGLSRNCPFCCDVVTKMDSEYVCKWCGQKLDWSEKNEVN